MYCLLAYQSWPSLPPSPSHIPIRGSPPASVTLQRSRQPHHEPSDVTGGEPAWAVGDNGVVARGLVSGGLGVRCSGAGRVALTPCCISAVVCCPTPCCPPRSTIIMLSGRSVKRTIALSSLLWWRKSFQLRNSKGLESRIHQLLYILLHLPSLVREPMSGLPIPNPEMQLSWRPLWPEIIQRQ